MIPKTGFLTLVAALLVQLSLANPPASRIKKIIYSDGSIRQFSYDATGKLVQEELTGPNQSGTGQIERRYNATGQLTSYSLRHNRPETPWNYGNMNEYTYDARGRLAVRKSYLLRQGTGANDLVKSLISSDSLLYNSAGQVVGQQQYAYGVNNSFVSQTPATLTTSSYQYNTAGNLIQESVTVTPLQSRLGGTSQSQKITYEYDDKTNPFYGAPYPGYDRVNWSKNNCIRVSSYNTKYSSQAAKPSVTEYNYVYDNGLPVRRTWKNSASLTEKYEYETVK